MLSWVSRFVPRRDKPEIPEERWREHYKAKQAALERILGPMDSLVGHAIVPFELGGPVDMHYFSTHMPGTVVATMDLIDPEGNGPQPGRLGTYELVACTRLSRFSAFDVEPGASAREGDFEAMADRICTMLTIIGHDSFEAVLEPGDACEMPVEDEPVARCIIFDEFDSRGIPFEVEGRRHGLLLCIEVHPSELQYAQKHGTQSLIARLKQARVYPYSDLDREPIV